MRNINNELKCSSPMYKRFFPSSSSLLPLPTSFIVDLMVNNINCRRGDLTRRNTHKYFSEENSYSSCCCCCCSWQNTVYALYRA